MKITLNFLAAAPNAGFMMAKQMGLYEKAGINLTIEEGKGSGTTAQMVATGQTDVGFADAPAAMQLRTKGAPVKIVAPVLQTNGFAIISLEDSGIASPKDLVGKKLAVQPGTAQTTLLDAILAGNGIDKGKVDVINIDHGAFVGALLEKKVVAILGGGHDLALAQEHRRRVVVKTANPQYVQWFLYPWREASSRLASLPSRSMNGAFPLRRRVSLTRRYGTAPSGSIA